MSSPNTNKKLPVYLKEIYGDFYNNKKLCAWADKPWLRTLLSLGNNLRLIDASLREIAQGDKVLQMGTTFGEQMDKVAMRVSRYGQYDVLDVSNIQIRRCKEKYGKLYSQMNFICQNANTPVKGDYDVVLLYMLLHEVPWFICLVPGIPKPQNPYRHPPTPLPRHNRNRWPLPGD